MNLLNLDGFVSNDRLVVLLHIVNMSKITFQVGALCVRRRGKKDLSILLVTSRDTGRWVIPKGWPKKGAELHKSAEREAFEEAGVQGSVGCKPIGEYVYKKRDGTSARQLAVKVFPLLVKKQCNDWPEKKERKRKWFPVSFAAQKVDEPELTALIKGLSSGLKRGELPIKA